MATLYYVFDVIDNLLDDLGAALQRLQPHQPRLTFPEERLLLLLVSKKKLGQL